MVAKNKILIVDDDANIAELISLYLAKECFDTEIVGDGESALRLPGLPRGPGVFGHPCHHALRQRRGL